MAGKFPRYGYVGIMLLFTGWAGNWFIEGLRTHILFFPQWLGLILLVDASVLKRSGTSLIKRNVKQFISLFAFSVPVWWLFELINLRNGNWYYTGREHFSDLGYFFLASLNFSIVIPAVFEMSEWVGTFRINRKLIKGPVIHYNKTTALTMIILGVVMFILDLTWPQYFFLFIWIAIYFIVEGINILLNNKCLVQFTDSGDWYPVYVLALGCLCCGFLWEFWNYFSYPKWIYRIPYVDFLKIFEMPVLGYLGYIPFAFEIYSIYMVLSGTGRNDESFIHLH